MIAWMHKPGVLPKLVSARTEPQLEGGVCGRGTLQVKCGWCYIGTVYDDTCGQDGPVHQQVAIYHRGAAIRLHYTLK